MSRVSFAVEADGIVRAAGLHDATLRSFSYDVGVRASFVLQGSDGGETEVVFQRPHLMNIASLWEGAIVGTVFLWRVNDVSPELWDEADNGWNALLDGRVHASAQPGEARRLATLHPASSLVVVSCSYGGTWAALVDGLHLLRR